MKLQGVQLDTDTKVWESELVRAQQVHTGFFPTHIPVINGIEIFAESRAAFHIGGDYYDFLCHNGKQLTFTIGDVCNKGVSAALVMAVIHKVLQTSVKVLHAPSPKDVLAYSNRDMYDELSRISMFATCFIGQFDVASRSLRYANAGHSPVLYFPADKPAQFLPADSVPLGVLPQSTFINQELSLAPGDLLVVATDGMVEWSEFTEKPYGYMQLTQRIEQVRHQSIQTVAQTLFDMADRCATPPLNHDDRTLLILRGVD